MLQTNHLKRALAEGKTVFGLLNSIPSPLLVEMIGYAGFDFVILDMEHVCVNPETLENMVRAAECAGVTPLVRVPSAAPDVILRALDCGAQGVVVPHVRTAGFGTIDLATYLARANSEIMVVAMIEDCAGVDNLDAILSVTGIDMVLEGAIDLSQSYGVSGQAQHPIVQEAIERIAAGCAARGIPFCAIPRIAEQAASWKARGVQAYLLGDDRGVSFRAIKAHLATFK